VIGILFFFFSFFSIRFVNNKIDLDNLTLKKREKKNKKGRRERADNESFSLSLSAPMAKNETYLGDGLVLELTGSLGELRELGSL